MASSEYLKHFESPLLEGISWEEMIEEGKAIEPHRLRQYLIEANEYLIKTPGPNQGTRAQQAPSWLGYWINYLERNYGKHDLSKEKFVKSTKLKKLENIGKELQQNKGLLELNISGLLFMGGGEGHPGHRNAVDHMRQNVNQVVLLFEQEEFLKSKARGGSFLPLEVRLSMWNYFPSVRYIGVTPKKPENVSFSEHYQNVFNITKADYCFVTEGDPNEFEKSHRGKFADFVIIPHLSEFENQLLFQTTDRVHKL
jgi:hypothetical protein